MIKDLLSSRTIKRAALIVGCYLALYALLDCASLIFRTDPVASIWYLSDGLSLALLLVFGVRYAPAIVFSALITNFVFFPNPAPAAIMVAWSIIFPLPFAATATLLRHKLRVEVPPRHLRDVAFLILGCLVLSLTLAGVFILTVLFSKGAMPSAQAAFAEWPAVAFRWWIGEAIGLVLVTPLVLLTVAPWLKARLGSLQRRTRPRPPVAIRSIAEASAQLLSIAIVVTGVFGTGGASGLPFFYLCFLPLVWITLRHGLRGATLAIALIDTGAILMAHFSGFPFDHIADLQIFMLTLGLTGLTLGAVVDEQRESETQSRRRAGELAAERDFREAVLQTAQVTVLILDSAGRIVRFNRHFEELSGVSLEEARGRDWFETFLPKEEQARIRTLFTGALAGQQTRGSVNPIVIRNGEYRWLEWYDKTLTHDSGEVTLVCIGVDVTEKRRMLRQQALVAETLVILNRPNEWKNLIIDILEAIQASTGVEAVAIRLEHAGDFPYAAVRGFPPEFVAIETSLVDCDAAGRPKRDAQGGKELACMCGNVICGRTDPAFPFFTEGGSFWTNSTTQLLASTTGKERQSATRDQCNAFGYESVALIPVRANGNTIGLLQLNDRRTDRFSAEMIQFFEELSASIGVAFKRQQAEERYRSLFERNMAGVYTTAMDGRFIACNRAFSDMLGFASPDEVLSLHASELYFNAADREEFLGGLHAAGEIVGKECRLRRKDGQPIWVVESASLIQTGSGGETTLQGTVVDVTQLRETKVALDENEAKYRQLVENLNDVIFTVDLAGMITYVSEPVRQLAGYAPEELVGHPFREIIHPDDVPDLDRRFRGVLENRLEPWDFRYRTKDREIRWARTSSRPIVESGRPVGIRGMLSDITDRKQAEQKIAALARFPAENPSPVLRVEESGKIVYANPVGESLLHFRAGEYLPPDWHEELVSAVRDHARRTADLNMGEQVYSVTFAPIPHAGYVNVYAMDVTKRKHGEAERNRLLARQVTLNRVTLALGALTELPAVLRTLYGEVRTLLDADGFFASRYYKDTQLITALFAIDEGGERDVSTFPPIPLAPEGKGMQSQVLRTGKPLNVPDWLEGERRMQTVHHLAPDGTFTPPPPETERDDCTKSALLVPLLFRGEPIGVLQVQSNRLNAYSDEDVDLLAGLANVAAISIQNSLLLAEAEQAERVLRLSLEGTLHAVSAAAETRDPYTAGHQRRVTALAVTIARELGLSDDECNTLRIAGTVHDIGKLGIPAEILSKPGPLSAIELDLIREHPQTAYKILADVPFPGPVAEIVLQHHERLDGSGYPRALAGDQMFREARILAVADVVEAMASHRPYRAARSIDAALGEIEQNAGRLYDSEAVEACIRLFRDKGYALPA